MKIHSILLFAAASGLVLASCGKLSGGSPLITIEAGIGEMTKVSYSGDKTTFGSGDQLSLFAWTGSATAVASTRVVDGVVNTFDGTKWTPASPMLWDDKSSEHYFLGVTPPRVITNFTADPYTLDPNVYTASDLMIATNLGGLTPSLTPVSLNFTHALARLDVNLSFRNQWASAPTVTAVSATAKKTATVNYLGKALTATGDAADVALNATSNVAWSGLQIPQSGVNTITIRIEDKDYVFTHTADIPLAGGKYTTVNLIVGRDKIELASSITIDDWTSQGAAISGEAQDE